MKTTPIKGTRDYLPREVRVRDYVQNQILNVYRQSGFVRIATPMLEDMENLDKSDGGDNLNLIFKILKRGEKLDKALAANDTQKLADL
ncbi:MAG: ATP phosphoribosyltransferase regulatory subunit, partial [Ruthenibacterium sp.]